MVPKWHGPIAMVFAMVATTLYLTHEHGCSVDTENKVEAGGWCAGDACSPMRNMCETDRERMESPPPCERVTKRWCAGDTCFRWQYSCTGWRDAQVRDGTPTPVCKLTPWR